MAALADGSGAVFVPVLPVELPADRSGLLVRPAGPVAAHSPLSVLEQNAAAVVGDPADLHFIAAERSSLTRVGLGLVASSAVAVSVVVLCPVGVSAQRSALALAVGDVLYARTGRPAVMCEVMPRMVSGPGATGHPVLVRDAAGAVTAALVWQVVPWAPVRGWLDRLAGSG
ncbi:hypothetical protein [Pseudofrankia sp. DC12]|uniref:hypothetical protein n=1 Tax=Pseudofrankia sp. DC12 TaxID=683315 RepID=UPI000B2FA0B6|nr:hypothetical protein [Pseudofrankia sp. DC12]